MKRFLSLAGLLALAGTGCREKPVDIGSLLTAKTVGLEYLQRGLLPQAEQEFRKVIAIAPSDPLGYSNLGLTYLRGGRYEDAESQLQRARRLDAQNPDVALLLAKLYALTGKPDDARKVLASVPADPRVLYARADLDRPRGDSVYAARLRDVLQASPANLAIRLKLADVLLKRGDVDSVLHYLEDVQQLRPEPPKEVKPHLTATIRALRAADTAGARVSFDRFVHLMQVTGPYQAALAKVNWEGEGPLPGRPVFDFNPASLITMRGIAPAAASAQVRFTDVTGESGLPSLGAPVTALALGDIRGDGEENLLVAAKNVRLYTVHGGFVADISDKVALPLPAGIVAATFADYDNDGWLDLFAIDADGRGYLLRNRDGKRFEDVTETAGLRDAHGARRAVFVDIDHDGDLDLLLIGSGSLAVYRNNLDGTFTLVPNAAGIARAASDVAFGDFDGDGRTDVVVASPSGVDAVYLNDAVKGFTEAQAQKLATKSKTALVGDFDNDGALDIVAMGANGGTLWHNTADGHFVRQDNVCRAHPSGCEQEAALLDYDNDGWLDLIVAGPGGASLFHNNGKGELEDRTALLPPGIQHDSITSLLVADLDNDGDPDILVGTRTGVHLLRNDGGNAHLGMRVQLSALGTGSGKNNAFGIGSRLEVRAGELYQTRVVTSPVTLFGLGNHFKADVLRVEWTNGVPQTIYFPGTDQDVLEAQQLKGSCAFLYAWNGRRFEFVTDFMWRSALGMPVGIMSSGNSAYAPAAASLEYVRIPGEMLKPKNGRYTIQVTEELWETAYLDQLRLLAVDHPDSVQVYVDERFPPMRGPGLRVFEVTDRRSPRSARDENGNDVLAELREHDFRYVANLTPRRYQGLSEPHAITLELDARAGDPGTHLFLRGWIYPSDASINVALAQQRALTSQMPVLEVRDTRGQWVSRGPIGFPAGKDKTMVIDLAGIFPTKDHHVRVRTNLQVYWDEAFVATDVDRQGSENHALRMTTLTPVTGHLHSRGFSRMYRRGGRNGPQWFDYDSVTITSPWRPITGSATRFGDVQQLLQESDDQYVIMVPGDETTVEFDAPPAPRSGWTRTFLLYSDGWIKDSDLNTAHGTTIEPLPYHAIRSYPYAATDSYPADEARRLYQREYNTRVLMRSHGVREER